MVERQAQEKFLRLCEDIVHAGHAEKGIGTYGEKYMHLILKHFFCPDPDWHEVGLGDFFADAVTGDEIYEIQTGGFYPLKKKLAYYLTRADKRVVVVCPVVAKKRLIWIDPETGATEESGRYTSYPRAQFRVLRELFWLSELDLFPHVRFRLVYLTVDEYRKLDGWGAARKNRATKLERIPVALQDMKDIASPRDVADVLLPSDLSTPFTSAVFSARTGLRGRGLSAALKTLERLGVIARNGKQGNAVLYEVLGGYLG